MFIADFLTMEKTNYNVRLTFWEYLQAKIDQKGFLLDLGIKYNQDFYGQFYYKGVRYAIK